MTLSLHSDYRGMDRIKYVVAMPLNVMSLGFDLTSAYNLKTQRVYTVCLIAKSVLGSHGATFRRKCFM